MILNDYDPLPPDVIRRSPFLDLGWLDAAEGSLKDLTDETSGRMIALGTDRRTLVQRTHHWLTAKEVGLIFYAASSYVDEDLIEMAPDNSGRVVDWRGDQPPVVCLRDEIVLRLGFTVGLRRSEIVGINLGDIDFAEQRLVLVGKGGKHATVYLPDELVNKLEEFKGYGLWSPDDPVVCRVVSHGFVERTVYLNRHGRLNPRSIQKITTKYADVTGIEFSPHDMRRTFAGLVFEKTGSIETTSAALRHSNIGTTQRYLESRQDAAYLATKGVNLGL
jgi:integrase